MKSLTLNTVNTLCPKTSVTSQPNWICFEVEIYRKDFG